MTRRIASSHSPPPPGNPRLLKFLPLLPLLPLLGTSFFFAALPLEAQTTIRRAEPVATPAADPNDLVAPADINEIQNPSWMERVRPAPGTTPFRPNAPATAPAASAPAAPAAAPARNFDPIPPSQNLNPGLSTPAAPPVIRPALPVNSPTPRPPASPPEPRREPAPLPNEPAVQNPPSVAPATAPGVSTAPATERDTPGATRIAPASEDQVQRARTMQGPKDIADAFYARRMYDMAIPEYETYLRTAPVGADRTAAWFRLAESFRHQEQVPQARSAYEMLLRENRSGEFAGAAAYRLAGLQMDEGRHLQAATNFEIAAREAPDAAVQLSATFFAGRCYELAGEKRRALEAFERTRKAGGADSRYEEYSIAAMARLSAELGRTAAAITLYQELAEKTTTPTLRVEALMKAAQLLIESGQNAQARKLLSEALAESKTPETKALARFGLLEMDFVTGDFAAAAAVPLADLETMPEASRARAFLLAANARRQTEDFAGALQLYDRILTDFPTSETAREARFQRLVCLFKQNDPGLMEALNQFLAEARDPAEVAQARMLKAETHFAASQWAEAAEAFGALGNARLPDRLLADAMFKNAWARAQIGPSQQTVVAYSEFIERFPKHDLTPRALVGRGMAHLENGASDAATRDFDNVLQNFPESGQREIALLQRALSFGSRRDYGRMKADFQQLVEEFPDSAARAQAEFWIGYAKFEEQDYTGALTHLEEARRRDAETYGARANLRIMLANYYLERPRETAREIETHEIPNVPSEVYNWLATRLLEEKDFAGAEKYLNLLLQGKAGDAPPPEIFLQLARSRILQKKFAEAKEPADRYLELMRDPAPRARGLLTLAEANLGAGQYPDALKAVEDAQLLQPEGRTNAEARILAGRIQAAQGNNEEAAKLFMTVAVLYDDETLSPEALRRAVDAYRKSGSTAEADKALEELRRRYPAAAETPVEG